MSCFYYTDPKGMDLFQRLSLRSSERLVRAYRNCATGRIGIETYCRYSCEMKRMNVSAASRWLCVPPAVVLSFFASLVLLIPADKCLDFVLWHLRFLPSERYLQLHLPWDGFVVALLFVLSGTVVAPGNRRKVALGLFILGGILAVRWFESMTGPASHIFPDPGGLHLGWPVGGTLAGGTFGIACVFAATSRSASAGATPNASSFNHSQCLRRFTSLPVSHMQLGSEDQDDRQTKERLWLTTMRWLCVLPAVGISFVASIWLAGLFNPFISNELFRRGLFLHDTFGGFAIELIWDGPLAAIAFVSAGALMAPRYRAVVALVLFVVGAYLTPGFVREWSGMLNDGDNIDEHIYMICMYSTIAGTYLAGVWAVAGVFFVTRGSASRLELIPSSSTTIARHA